MGCYQSFYAIEYKILSVKAADFLLENGVTSCNGDSVEHSLAFVLLTKKKPVLSLIIEQTSFVYR